MQIRFVKSQHVLAAVAIAWTAGIVLLNLAYVRPNLHSQTERLERDITSEWLRLANHFVRTRKAQLQRMCQDWSGSNRIQECLDQEAAAQMLEQYGRLNAAGRYLSGVAIVDQHGAITSVWNANSDDKPGGENTVRRGQDTSELDVIRYQPTAPEISGLGSTPWGIGLFARHEIRRPDGGGGGAVIIARSLDKLLLTEMSALTGTNICIKQASEMPAQALVQPLGHRFWREEDHSLKAAEPLRDCSGQLLGFLVVDARAEPSYLQSRTVLQALITTVLWAACFALLMIVVIHAVIAGPTARLLRRVERMRSGEEVSDLSAGLRGEALVLANRFAEVLGRVEKISETDSLTGVANRRSFRHLFVREFHRARRYNRPMTLVILDLDYLKAANDVLGHQTGDMIIQVFSQVISQSVRGSDIVARLGGDEFAILMPETTEQEAAKVAERIRIGISAKSIGRGEVKITPTASIGVADLYAKGADTPDNLFNLSDKAMYAAKKGGRNRVVLTSQADQIMGQSGQEETKVDHLCKQLAGLDAKFKRLFIEAIGGLISALEARDAHTANHSSKVRHYALLIARQLDLPQRTMEHIGRAAMLHDIGKIGMPDNVLLKEGSLTESEWELVKRHPVVSVRIMEGMEFLDQEIPAVRYHHERYDGNGYPEGLSGSSIPLAARILSVADAFDAMTSSRVYREGMPMAQALEELRRGSGRQFDPAVIDAFMKLVNARQITDATVGNTSSA